MSTRRVPRFSISLAAIVVSTAALSCETPRGRTDAVDGDLARYIDTLSAIDVHAHPMRFVATGAPKDSEYDALPLDAIPPFVVPFPLRPEHPLFRAAQHALFGVSETDTGAAFASALTASRARTIQQRGEKYGEWVLDQMHISQQLANRVAMGAGLPANRFRWVSFVDALMLPLDVTAEAKRTPDVGSLYALEAKLLTRYLADLGLARIPPTLEAYEQQVVAPTLARQKHYGAVAIKFEAAYLRPLTFEPADVNAARAIYARYANGGTPTHDEYTLLQNHLFRVIARAAGPLSLTVHIHSIEGFGGFYDTDGAAPHNLESAFNDPTLRGTTFVILHGGWPRVDETMALFAKPNVYADISMMDILAAPDALARTLRMWLSDTPEKVLFGTDAFDGGDAEGWEQVAWVASHNARHALAVALSGMMRDGEITSERARALARMVLRDNAQKAHHLIATQ